MQLTNIITEADYKTYTEACQINRIEIVNKVRLCGIFGVEYEITINVKTPEQIYKLGFAVGKNSLKSETSVTDYEKNKCYI